MARRKETINESFLADKFRAKILALAIKGKLTHGTNNWKMVKGRDLFEETESKKPKGDYFDYIDTDAVDNKTNKIVDVKHLPCAKAPSRASRGLKVGDVLFSKVRPYLRNIALVEEQHKDCIATTGFFVCRSKLCAPKYLFFMMLSPYVIDGLMKFMKGNNSPSINEDNIKNFEFPVPPTIEEQKEIADKVEALLAEVDHIREAEKIISLCASRLRASILQNALQGHLTRGNHHWIQSTLGEVFTHNTGKALNGSDKDGTLMTYITTSNLYWNEFRLENLKQMRFTESELEKCTVRRGDLLVCEGGDIGRAAIWDSDEPMRIQNHIHRLRPKGECCVKFFYYVFRHLKDNGLIGGKGIGIQGLSSKALDKIEISYPPSLAEQEEIVGKVEALLAEVDHLTSK